MVTEDVHDRSVDCMNTSFLFGDGSIKLQKKINQQGFGTKFSRS
jgi:hypothetical protein